MNPIGGPTDGEAAEERHALVEDEPPLRRFGSRVLRHWEWARSQGLGRLVEEDQLNPIDRVSNRYRKWRWRRAAGLPPGQAVPVFLVGVQRSGTNMIARGLEASPEFEVHNENDTKVFTRYRLRSDEVVREVVSSSRHRFVLFKPLADSHRVGDLLDQIAPGRGGRALWAYRPVDERVRSAIAKFGDANLRVLEEIAAGRGSERWQAQRLSQDSLTLIRSFRYDEISPESAAALFWYVRNALYFDLGLHERGDVTLVSYRSMVDEPDKTMRNLCAFLGLAFSSDMISHVAPHRSPARAPITLDPLIRRRCDDLQARLDAAAAEKAALQQTES